jgi:hypothetical protein
MALGQRSSDVMLFCAKNAVLALELQVREGETFTFV